jgi:hypothetical protein
MPREIGRAAAVHRAAKTDLSSEGAPDIGRRGSVHLHSMAHSDFPREHAGGEKVLRASFNECVSQWGAERGLDPRRSRS